MILFRILPHPRPLTQYEIWLTIRLRRNQARKQLRTGSKDRTGWAGEWRN